MSEPLLSVCLITYNHAKYIREAIDGVLMQKVTFSWELIIADDFSTDGTREIVLEYKNKYPDFIKLILQGKNVGAAQNWMDLMAAPSSKYIAYFEGDDYWTDPLKLQKQVDILETNPDFALCFHNVNVIYEDGSKATHPLNIEQKGITTIEDVINGWYIATASMVYRNCLKELPDWLYKSKYGDYALHLMLAHHGAIYYIDEILAVYRRHPTGVSSTFTNDSLKYGSIELLLSFNRYTNNKYKQLIHGKISDTYKKLASRNRRKRIIVKYFDSLCRSIYYNPPTSARDFKSLVRYLLPSKMRRFMEMLFLRIKREN